MLMRHGAGRRRAAQHLRCKCSCGRPAARRRGEGAMRPGHAEYTSSNEDVECANLSRAGAAAVATAAWRAHDRRRAVSGPARRALDLHSFAPAPDATAGAVELAA